MEILTIKEFTKRQFDVLLRGEPNIALYYEIRGGVSLDENNQIKDSSNAEYKGEIISEKGNIKIVKRKLDNKIISFGESSSADTTLIEFFEDCIHCTVINVITGEKKIIEINQFENYFIIDEEYMEDMGFSESVKTEIRKASNFGTIEFGQILKSKSK